MATVTMNLNAAATRMFAKAPKVRIRQMAGELQLRPTDRVSGTNLPKGEILRRVSMKNRSTAKFNMPATAMHIGNALSFTGVKHGWYVLKQCPGTHLGVPAVRVSRSAASRSKKRFIGDYKYAVAAE